MIFGTLSPVVVILLYSVNVSASTITLDQSPKEIKPTITKYLTITCALVDSAPVGNGLVGRSVTSSNIKHLTSLAIFRNSVEIASVTVYSGPKGFVDKDTMTVAGNISATASGGEAGYLSVTWQDPSESQTGNFSCEGNGLSGSDHTVSYTTSLAVVMTAPNLSDVVGFIHQLDLIDRKYKETIDAHAQTVKDLQNQITQLTADLAKKTQDSAVCSSSCISDLSNKIMATNASVMLDINHLLTMSNQIRLVGGDGRRYGTLEVTYNGMAGPVCDDYWTIQDANVACRMLGWSGAIETKTANFYKYPDNGGFFVLDNVKCGGTEDNLIKCSHKAVGAHDCGHGEEAGVVCSNTRL